MKTKKISAELVNFMGNDDFVVNSARVSFDNKSDNFSKEKNEKLIKFLAKNGHWSPFSHPQITFLISVPIFVARQDFKHQIGFSRNEISRRYVSHEPEFFEPESWRNKPEKGIKQGSSENVDEFSENIIKNKVYDNNLRSLAIYNELIEKGVCPEQARMVLTQSMMTSYYSTGSLYAWARAFNLRTEKHAQKEIQELYKKIGSLIGPLFPVSWRYLTNE